MPTLLISANRSKKHIAPDPNTDPSVAAADGVDRFSVLPGELRNAIYELVIPIKTHVEVRARSTERDRFRVTTGFKRKANGARQHCWFEPSILRVSKQIRTECKSIYYHSNTFKIYARPSEFQNTLDFLEQKSSIASATITIDCVVRVVQVEWKDLPEWWYLALIAYSTGLRADDSDIVQIEVMGFNRNKIAGFAMLELWTLSRKAVMRQLDFKDFEEDFIEWALGKLPWVGTLGSGRSNLMVRELSLVTGVNVGQRLQTKYSQVAPQ